MEAAMKRHCLCIVLFLVPVLLWGQVVKTARQKESELTERDRRSNGIIVLEPKLYDDALLQQMLNAAQARLAALQVLDQTAITARIGGITGATQEISGFSLNAQGLPSPQVQTTDKGATTQIVQDTTPKTTTTTTAPVHDVVTTAQQLNASIPTVPASSTSLPTSPAAGASAILNEQMQLTYEIAGLRLLLEGALSDRIVKNVDTNQQAMRTRLTLGFPISLRPDKRFKNAVAVVEVEVDTDREHDITSNGSAPAVIALLPREKTYNVAAITDRSTSIGLGLVTQVASVGGSFLRGRKTWYVVQDQDTVAAMTDPPTKDVRRTAFDWQFRPVLGESVVRSEDKRTYVQLAFPAPAGTPSGSQLGTVLIRTYWRKYDSKRGIAKAIITGTLKEAGPFPIRTFDMEQTQHVAAFAPADLEDIGGGQMLVKLRGAQLGGTYIRVGNNLLIPGSPGITSEAGLLRFVANISDLATKQCSIVSRDGTEVSLRFNNDVIDHGKLAIKNDNVEITTIDDSNSLVQFELEPQLRDPTILDRFPPILVIGTKVFGYSDSPIKRSGNKIEALIPTSLLTSNREMTVKPLLVHHNFFATGTLLPSTAAVEHLVLVDQGSPLRFLLYGSKLASIHPVFPPPDSVTITSVGDGQSDDTVRMLNIDDTKVKTANVKQLILQRTGEKRPFTVAMPSLTPEPKPVNKFRERVTVGADEAVILGDALKDVTKITALKMEMTNLERPADGKSIKVKGLIAAGITAVARSVEFELTRPGGKSTTIQLEVVSSKVELLQ
jgi:hypothetical protein